MTVLEKKMSAVEAMIDEGVYLIQNQNGAFYTEEGKWSFYPEEAKTYKTEAPALTACDKIVHSFKRPPRTVLSDDCCSYGYFVDTENNLAIQSVWTSTKLFTNVHFEEYFKNDIEAELFVQEYPQREQLKKQKTISALERKLAALKAEV